MFWYVHHFVIHLIQQYVQRFKVSGNNLIQLYMIHHFNWSFGFLMLRVTGIAQPECSACKGLAHTFKQSYTRSKAISKQVQVVQRPFEYCLKWSEARIAQQIVTKCTSGILNVWQRLLLSCEQHVRAVWRTFSGFQQALMAGFDLFLSLFSH